MFGDPAPATFDRMPAAQKPAADQLGLEATGRRVWGTGLHQKALDDSLTRPTFRRWQHGDPGAPRGSPPVLRAEESLRTGSALLDPGWRCDGKSGGEGR